MALAYILEGFTQRRQAGVRPPVGSGAARQRSLFVLTAASCTRVFPWVVVNGVSQELVELGAFQVRLGSSFVLLETVGELGLGELTYSLAANHWSMEVGWEFGDVCCGRCFEVFRLEFGVVVVFGVLVVAMSPSHLS